MVVKGDSALVKVPELNFEIPPSTQKGVVTTIEGLLSKSVGDLLKEQPVRKVKLCIFLQNQCITFVSLQNVDPGLASKIEEFTEKLQGCLKCATTFTIVS